MKKIFVLAALALTLAVPFLARSGILTRTVSALPLAVLILTF